MKILEHLDHDTRALVMSIMLSPKAPLLLRETLNMVLAAAEQKDGKVVLVLNQEQFLGLHSLVSVGVDVLYQAVEETIGHHIKKE